MAYEFLKKLFGTPKDGEEPKAMTYAELEAAIDADQENPGSRCESRRLCVEGETRCQDYRAGSE